MTKTTNTGRVFRARSADRHETVRYVSGLGTVVLAMVGGAVVAVALFPSILGWFQ